MSLFSFLYQNLKIRLITVSLSSLFVAGSVQATTVQFQTVMGNIEVNLFDKTTPETVKNFLAYVNAGEYNNSLIHRAAITTKSDGTKQPFVIQGGGYTYPDALPLKNIKSRGTVVNEPVYSNLRGTIAMAKPTGAPNGASSQWFFNLHNDNATSLDPNLNGSQGFTVFGQVTEASLPVLDAIVAVNTFVLGSGFTEFPLRNYTLDDYRNNAPADETNLVLITNVIVLNADANTADSLNPTKNTLLVIKEENKGGGGGSLGLWQLLLLIVLGLSVRKSRSSNLNNGY
jgi:peptidyl-prolyl cis-trans isomerase A (cyclophilin A)